MMWDQIDHIGRFDSSFFHFSIRYFCNFFFFNFQAAEDKVVYATLALSEQSPAEKPPPAFSEYAEIVYTDQGQKDVKETA